MVTSRPRSLRIYRRRRRWKKQACAVCETCSLIVNSELIQTPRSRTTDTGLMIPTLVWIEPLSDGIFRSIACSSAEPHHVSLILNWRRFAAHQEPTSLRHVSMSWCMLQHTMVDHLPMPAYRQRTNGEEIVLVKLTGDVLGVLDETLRSCDRALRDAEF